MARDSRELRRVAGFDHEMPAPAVLDALHRTFRWPHDRDVALPFLRELRAKTLGRRDRELHRLLLARPAEDDVRQPDRGRVRRIHTPLELLCHEAIVIVLDRAANGVVLGNACLDEDLAALWAASRAPGHLTQQLKTALRRPEIGKEIGRAHV